jgi:hypothetical protein
MRKLSLVLVTALAGGCLSSATLVREHNPRSVFEAGAVTISASAPIRWEDVAGDLRPEFNSQSAAAQMSRVLPVTQNDTLARREGTSIEFGATVQGETLSSTDRRVQDLQPNNQTPTITETATTERRQGPAQMLTGIDGAAVSAPGTGVFRDVDPPNSAVPAAVDPILQARAAVALHQELVLLDNYLDNAYDPCLQEAWLVRTRVVATPYARNQPIDVYATIYASYSGRDDGSRYWDGLRLVPLLVTDNFERSDTRRYEQLAAQVQASLNGVSGVVAAGLGFNRYLNNLNAILGTQYNNLLTISQIDDYTLQVRLGAAFSPTSRYEMQSRSYDITFLLVIDKQSLLDHELFDPIALNFVVTSEMRDAENGRSLQPISRQAHRDLIRRLRDAVGDSNDVRALRERLDPPQIWEIVENLRNDRRISEPMYRDLSRWALAVDGGVATLYVSRSRVFGLPGPQTGVFYDSIVESSLRARIAGATGLTPRDVYARLTVGSLGEQNYLALAADHVVINPDGVLDATFPSVGGLGFNPDARPVSLELSRRCPGVNEVRSYPLLRNRASFASATPPPATFEARAVTTTIVPAPDNHAVARIAILAVENQQNPYVFGYRISITGGGIIDRAERLGAGGAPLPASAVDLATNSVRVGREFGAYSLDLSNVAPSSTLSVTVNAIGEGGEIIRSEARTFAITVAARPS